MKHCLKCISKHDSGNASIRCYRMMFVSSSDAASVMVQSLPLQLPAKGLRLRGVTLYPDGVVAKLPRFPSVDCVVIPGRYKSTSCNPVRPGSTQRILKDHLRRAVTRRVKHNAAILQSDSRSSRGQPNSRYIRASTKDFILGKVLPSLQGCESMECGD